MAVQIVAVLLSLVALSAAKPPGVFYYHQAKETLQGAGGYEVTYDNRSFSINGQRLLLLSGAVHYPRVMAGEWSDIFHQMVYDGLNTVQTYIYWNLHEPVNGQGYNFSGNKNWTRFVEEAAAAGLFVTLRIGPFVGSEWDYGSIPHWINSIPGMVVRSSNDPWKKEMSRFFTDIVNMARPYFASNGGPILLGQIENEFRWNDPDYVEWCGQLVTETVNGSIPFLMCNGYSANNTVNTCNGNDCAEYAEEHVQKFPGQPMVWTENEGWFQSWNKLPGSRHDNRTAEDVANVVMKWLARGGSYHNYYMWYGGNNFGRRAGSCIATEYANYVNLYSDALPNQPKRAHMQRLHYLLIEYSHILLDSPIQVDNKQKVLLFNSTSGKFINTTGQFAYVYGPEGKGVAFVENDVNETVLVNFMGKNFTLPQYSVSLVRTSDFKELYNSGKVNAAGLPTQRQYATISSGFNWNVWQEDITKLDGSFLKSYPLEQLNVTNDLTDYLFYQTTITGPTTGKVNITVESRIANSLLAYIDGKLQSSAEYCDHTAGPKNYTLPVSTEEGKAHNLTILSVSLGINTHTEPGDFDLKGIIGQVWLGSKNITEGKWLHRPMLEGERLHVYTAAGMKNVSWSSSWSNYTGMSLVWYRYIFTKPSSVPKYSSLLLDLAGMKRGYIYLNGINLGRYWLTQIDNLYVQQYYFIPQSILQKDNMLVLGEELGAPAPEKVKLVECKMIVPS